VPTSCIPPRHRARRAARRPAAARPLPPAPLAAGRALPARRRRAARRAAAQSLPAPARPAPVPRGGRGITLAVVLCAQLMIVLDMTVVNVALPSIAHGLHLSAPGLAWVLNAYSLTFGGLLLLGGRAGDILGRRTVFLAGVAIFTAASLAGGLATSAAALLAARAVQGAGGAIASPAVLATIASSFPGERERARALGAFTAVSTGGGSLGLILGGIITQWASWRLVLFVNVPVGIAVVIAGRRLLPRSARRPGRFDLAGALTSTAGVSALVYGFIRAASDGWSDRVTLAAFAAAGALLTAFVAVEARSAEPVTPLRLFADRSRSASYGVRMLLVGGMFGMFFFLTQFVQEVLRFSPLRAGLAFVPMTVTLFAVSRLAPRLLARFGSKALMVAGSVPVIAAMAWLTRITPATSYLPGIAGPMVLFGAGVGLALVPLAMASLAGVRPADSGAAASMVNVTQQVGGALGLAILVTVFGAAARVAGASRGAPRTAAGPGERAHLLARAVAASFGTALAFDVLALLVILLAISVTGQPAAVPAAES